MSKTKYVGFADRGFWAYDVGLGAFLKHFIDAVEASDEARAPWLSAAGADSRIAPPRTAKDLFGRTSAIVWLTPDTFQSPPLKKNC